MIGQCFDACFDRFAQPTAVFRVDLVGGTKIFAVAPLHDEQDHRAVAFAFEPDEFFQVFGGALADGVGKGGGAVETSRDVFYFDETAAVASVQTKIEPAVAADFDFSADGFVAAQFLDHVRVDRFGDQVGSDASY